METRRNRSVSSEGGKGKSRGCRITFRAGVLIAAVATHQIAIIALFNGIDDTVPVARKSAVGTAETVGSICIARARIALFAEIDPSIPAAAEQKMTTCVASVGKGGMVDREFALLTETALNHAVSARSPLQ